MIKKMGDDKAKNVISVMDPEAEKAKIFCQCGKSEEITKEAFKKNEKPKICSSCGKPRQ